MLLTYIAQILISRDSLLLLLVKKICILKSFNDGTLKVIESILGKRN